MADTLLSCVFPLHNLKYLQALKAEDNEQEEAEFKNYAKYLASLSSSLISKNLVIYGPPSM